MARGSRVSRAGTRTSVRPLMGLSSPLDGTTESECSDEARCEKLLWTEPNGVERGEALGLIGAFASFEAAEASGFLAESSSKGPISKQIGRFPANLVTSGAEDGPT